MSEPTFTISADGSAITCHRCGMTSHHPQDVQHRYCGECHMFHADALGRIGQSSEEPRRDLGDGRAIWLVPQFFDTYLLCIGPIDSEAYADQWQYQDLAAALIAFVSWQPDQQSEPDGWYRHQRTGRRRPDGDPTKEYVHF